MTLSTATTYTWRIDAVRTAEEPRSKYVVEVAWTLYGACGQRQVGLGDRTRISTDPAAEFTAYEDLTESVVVEWLTNTLGSEAVSALEAKIHSIIEARYQPVTEVLTDRGLPWAAASTATNTSG
jgi:hypothetical protein